MSSTIRGRWFVPFRHVTAEDLERWLESEAEQGWAPCRLGQWSSIRMRLASTGPSTTRYVVDLQTRPERDYLTVFTDAGWEHVGHMASMHVWRRDYREPRPEAFTDRPSLVARNRRLALATLPSAAVLLLTTAVLTTAALLADPDDRLQLGIAAGFGALITAAVGTASIMLWRAAKQPGTEHSGSPTVR